MKIKRKSALRIGCVKYLNARPLIHGWEGEVVLDHPSALCAQLARGDLDVALVSSFEFLRNPIYRIVDGVSIASDGLVYSVVVAHRGKFANTREIALDPAAQTSGNLLRCLLGELNLNPSVGSAPSNSGESARLLIGDQAICFRQQHGDDFEFWDLGEQWKKLQGVPFVYALWLVRPEVENAKSIADRLRRVRDDNLRNLDTVIASQREFPAEFCRQYYHKYLRFSFGEEEKQGLRAFAELCRKHRLLPKRDLVQELV
ncbi:MAG TPA: menaquinone biosynthesis protein [Chthoniobacterales bacterium]|jgi:chorismate dehydratase|nr:menaquinone biosynthesis protein [Chthoniobacterales bacterium]